jgi:hypothetical protein
MNTLKQEIIETYYCIQSQLHTYLQVVYEETHLMVTYCFFVGSLMKHLKIRRLYAYCLSVTNLEQIH